MCELMTALTIGGTIMGAAGQIQSGNAQADAANYNATVQRNNAALADKQSKQVLEAGAQQEQKQRAMTQQLIGKQTASMAANGVDVSFGTPVNIIGDTAKMGEQDAQTIRTNAYRNYDDVRNQGIASLNQASLYDMQADNSRTAGTLNAVSTVLTGGAQAYKSYKSAKIGQIT